MTILKLRTRRTVLHPQLTDLLVVDRQRLTMEPNWFGVVVKLKGEHPRVVPWGNVVEVVVDSDEGFMEEVVPIAETMASPRSARPLPATDEAGGLLGDPYVFAKAMTSPAKKREPRPDADCYRAALDASVGPLAKLEVVREGYESGVLSKSEAAEMLSKPVAKKPRAKK